ncbi:MAG: hypothetical protein ACE5JO_11405, partial [Candidatus Binatia bacterium]
MKLASFFLISVAFHAAILALPVSFHFYEVGKGRIIPVIFLSGGGDSGQGSAGKSRVERGRGKASPGVRRQRHVKMQRSGSENLNAASRPEETTEAGNRVHLHTQDVAGGKSVMAGLSKTNDVEEDWGVFLEGVAEGSQ